jgi:Mn-dependent DtxR family transcriptional regulator
MQYLEYLKERGLVVERDGAVRLTERGLEVAKALDKALSELL